VALDGKPSKNQMKSLKEILGHNSLKMVERYSHLASAYKEKFLIDYLMNSVFAKYLPKINWERKSQKIKKAS